MLLWALSSPLHVSQKNDEYSSLPGESVPTETVTPLKAVGKHVFDVAFICFADECLLSEFSLSLWALFGQDMTVIRFIVKYFFLSRHFEPFLCALVGL